jgi:hypothetical protein
MGAVFSIRGHFDDDFVAPLCFQDNFIGAQLRPGAFPGCDEVLCRFESFFGGGERGKFGIVYVSVDNGRMGRIGPNGA